jgi:hypothetical protein
MLASAKIIGNSIGVVILGTIGTLGTSFDQRWTAAERALWTLDKVPSWMCSVIVGIILSDCNLQLKPKGVNAYLRFAQSMSHFPYFYSVFWIIAPLCQGIFKFGTGLRKGTVCYFIRFHTRSLPFLTELYHLFYVKGVKVIPAVEIMYDLLTPEALAHWIMGDGKANISGLILCTDSFTIIDNVKLMNILMVRYQLECTLHGNNRIYIKVSSMPRLRSIVLPHMCNTILYKLGL